MELYSSKPSSTSVISEPLEVLQRPASSLISPAHLPEPGGQSGLQRTTGSRVSISGVSTAVPEHSIAQTDAAQMASALGVTHKYRKSLDTMYRLSGVQRRHCVVLDSSAAGPDQQSFYSPSSGPGDHGLSTGNRMEKYESFATNLALEAGRKAIAAAGIDAGKITHLVTISCSGFAAPGVDLALVEQLGLSRNIERAHVGFMGCHGALNGLRVARGWSAADPDACVLVCAVELCSLHHQYTEHAQQLVANALFSDGACAFLVQ